MLLLCTATGMRRGGRRSGEGGVKEGGRRRGKIKAVMSVRPTAIQYKCDRAELSLHSAAAADALSHTHTPYTKTHTLSHRPTSHIHHTTLTEAPALPVQGDATGRQPLSKSSLSLSLCLLLHLSFCSLSHFIYLSHSPLSLWSDHCFLTLRDFSNFSLSMLCTYLSLHSLSLSLSNPSLICMLAESQSCILCLYVCVCVWSAIC